MNLLLASIIVSMLVSAADGQAAELEAALAAVEVTCSSMKTWGKDEGGEPWLRFQMSCNLPEEARALVEGHDPVALLSSLRGRDAKYSASAAVAALGRLWELPAAERARLVLELARRENEPFASAFLAFVFGTTPWWETSGDAFQRALPLGELAAPWDRSMTPVLRKYLLTGLENRPVSTLAVYLCNLMTEVLDPEILPDLEAAARLAEEGSLEARMAREALDKLEALLRK